MYLSFPHFENLYIPLLALFQELGAEVLLPPPPTEETLNLGQLHAPESSCLPARINLGSLIQALEEGADTLIMVGGVGPCRLGHFAQLQEMVLRDMGYDFQMVILEPDLQETLGKIRTLFPSLTLPVLVRALRWAWLKLRLLELIEAQARQERSLDGGGRADRLLQKRLEKLQQTETRQGLLELKGEILEQRRDDSSSSSLRVALVGDIYTIIDSFANLGLERMLGEMGVFVYPSITFTEWIKEHLFLRPLGLIFRDPVQQAAMPYLKSEVGGMGLESVGRSVLYAQQGFDGVLQLVPFTCMPEIVAESILPRVSRDWNLPLMTILFDDQRCREGMRIRVEAFIDLMENKRRAGNSNGQKKGLLSGP